ncbi:MAG: serine hydrolase [Rhodothermales bacterium]|nr:serine hydrolase [Rhodothermales bacterium]
MHLVRDIEAGLPARDGRQGGSRSAGHARVRHILSAVTTVAVWLLLPSLAAAQMASVPEVRLELQGILESQHQLQGQTGLVAAVRFPDGSIWEGVAGWADPTTGEELRVDHRFGFASITKTFVAAVVLQLVDEGVLDLGDSVGDFAGPFTYVNSSITIRQLLGHTSGVYNYTDHPDLVGLMRQDLNRVFSPEEMLAYFLEPPLYFAGSGASYSNSNYIILQIIVEAATGNALGDEIRSRLLEPLRLTATTFGGDEPPNGAVPTTWSDLTGNGSLDNFSGLYLAVSHNSARAAPGSMFSTVADIASWAHHLFDPTMFTAPTRSNMLDWHALSGVGPVWTGYGLGVQQFMFDGTEAWGHSGWISGSRSIMVYAPEYGFSVAAVDNDATSSHGLTAQAFVEYLRSLDYTTTAVEEPPGLHPVSVYPNPVRVGGQLSLSRETDARFELYDLLGRRVLVSSGDQEAVRLDATAPGVYIWRLVGTSEGGSGILNVSR